MTASRQAAGPTADRCDPGERPADATETAEPGSHAGRSRRRLCDELDRLDRMLDVLGDGLAEAVTDAVRAGARAAVRETVVEVLAEYGLRTLTDRAGPEPRSRRDV